MYLVNSSAGSFLSTTFINRAIPFACLDLVLGHLPASIGLMVLIRRKVTTANDNFMFMKSCFMFAISCPNGTGSYF